MPRWPAQRRRSPDDEPRAKDAPARRRRRAARDADAHRPSPIVLASGWRRAGDRLRRRRGRRRWRWRRSMPGRCCFSPFPMLVWLVDGSAAGRWNGVWRAAVAGWCFGFGYFLAGLYWIGYAFLVDAKTFGWLLPIAVAGLPAYLAIFTGARPRRRAADLGARAPRACWRSRSTLTGAEWLRGHLLSGFPWNTFGYALTAAAGAGAERVAGRHLGPDISRGRDLRQPGGARRRPRRHAASLSRAGAGADAARGDGRLRRRRGLRRTRPNSSTACSCASCSRTCSRTPSSITAPRPR